MMLFYNIYGKTEQSNRVMWKDSVFKSIWFALKLDLTRAVVGGMENYRVIKVIVRETVRCM